MLNINSQKILKTTVHLLGRIDDLLQLNFSKLWIFSSKWKHFSNFHTNFVKQEHFDDMNKFEKGEHFLNLWTKNKNVYFLKLPEHFLNLWTKLKNMNYYWIFEQNRKARTFSSIPKHFLNLENKFWNREHFQKIL